MAKTYDFTYTCSDKTFEFRSFCDLLNEMSAALSSPSKILLNLENPFFFGPTGMVPFVALVSDLEDKGWDIDIEAPANPEMSRYWDSAGWISGIEGTTPPQSYPGSTYSPLVSYRNSSDLNLSLNTMMDILSKVSEFQSGVMSAIEWTLQEISDNVLVHSEAKGWIQIISRPKKHQVDLVVADRGLGIQRTLRESYPQITNDSDALRMAIQKGVTRNKLIGQGNGLAGSVRIAEALNGYVNILSGSANLRLFDDGSIHDQTVKNYDGTVVTITLPTDAPIDLGNALWGYQPMRTFEMSHITEAGILFKLHEEATGFGNRGSGNEVATKLKNLMTEYPEENVVIDFESIDTPSASFLDEFLGKMIKAYGPASFFSRVHFIKMNDFTRRTADEVISQRLKV